MATDELVSIIGAITVAILVFVGLTILILTTT